MEGSREASTYTAAVIAATFTHARTSRVLLLLILFASPEADRRTCSVSSGVRAPFRQLGCVLSGGGDVADAEPEHGHHLRQGTLVRPCARARAHKHAHARARTRTRARTCKLS
eukprot:1633818-Pleurochrysis_carterae.AAC.1